MRFGGFHKLGGSWMEMLGNIRWMEVGLFGKQVMLLPLPRTVRSEPAFCVGCYSLIC